MAHKDIHGIQSTRVIRSHNLEEVERVGNLPHDFGVLLPLCLGFDMRECPREGVVEVGDAGGELSADVVEGCGGVEVGLDESRWVGGAL